MPPLSREQLAARRHRRRALDKRRHRRLLVAIATPVAVVAMAVALTLLALSTVQGVRTGGSGGIAAPVVPPSGAPKPPQAVVLASAGSVQLRLPVDRTQITAIVFRAVDDPDALPLSPADGISYDVAPDNGTPGPDTASVDVGAAAGTAVYSPVTGTIGEVTPYVVSGTVQGYELVIQPDSAADRSIVITHLETLAGGSRPVIGERVRAGESLIGQVRDFTGVAVQRVAEFTADSGNHVHIEVVHRLGADLLG